MRHVSVASQTSPCRPCGARVPNRRNAAAPSDQADKSTVVTERIGTGSADRQAALAIDALEAGVVLLSRDMTVTYANAVWNAWAPSGIDPSRSFRDAIAHDRWAAIAESVRSTLSDGVTRAISLSLRSSHADTPARRLVGVLRRHGDGVMIEARLPGDDDAMATHDLARQLAEVTDMSEVLRTLCDIATRQCHGTGAAVLRVLGQDGEIVAASGEMLPARGRCFALQGSMLADAVARNAIVSEADFRGSGRPLTRVLPDLPLGPVVAAPLQAHGETLGVLAISRGEDEPRFSEREVERLRILADHAALAVHKSLLLQQAQSADRAKGRFLATMSHELRTPLTALAGYNELLADQVVGPLSSSQLDIVDRMRSVTTHLSSMIEEILAFTSLEDGHERARPSDFLAEDLVRAAVAVIEPLALQKGLPLMVSLPGVSIRMSSDIDKARQILVNLLGNAVKFTDTGSVSVRLSQSGRTIRLDVKDSGVGISDDALNRLFRPFSQVDTGLTRRHGGTGLGLYISRRLARMLGGHIEVESRPGQGSTFSVLLPVDLPG